ncbi:hypothetical protein N5S72_09760 [Aliarcobacter cryaerophilus]|uniref:hypothetical protein n=1 Tax=Aliarcobacter cryaerophilus TaxID=28198 RepID=UPI0021B462A6|nr:hypothetical protein [Aliarcobacter cryaerophilus]MCT7464734.1 hypothetical protein [Aliarcobacter cryaerophilus]
MFNFLNKKNKELKNEAYSYLKKFLDTAEILENTQSHTIQRDSKSWYELLDNIGDSINTLYKFHNFLINNHSYFEAKAYEKQLCSFYMDMFISKIKHTFFTEYPQVPTEELSKNKASGIYINGLKLFENIDETVTQKTLFLFYYKIFLFYDFVYDKDTKKGKFTKFKTDKDKVNKTIKLLKDIEMTSIKDFRKSLSKIIPKTIDKQLELGFEDEKSPYEIYNSYLKNDYEIEPLSYFTIFKIWKISKFLQDKFEESDSKDLKDFESKFLAETKNYIDKSVDIIEKSYKNNSSDIFTKETYSLDKEYMENIIYKYVHQKEEYLVKKEIEKIKVDIENKTSNIDSELLKDAIKNHILRCNDLEEPWKFNRIFENGTKDNLLNLSYALYSLVKEKDSTFVGLYKSGALLAHILNICDGLKDNVYLFTTFPYVAIHPRSFDIRDENKNFIIVDENYKTGFTNLIAKEYINRRKKHSLDILSLVLNSDYKQIKDEEIKTIGSIKNKTLNIFYIDEVSCVDIEKICKYIKENYKKYIDDKFLRDFITIEKNGIKEYDITRVLSSSVVLFSIAYNFLDKLDNAKKEVFFQAPTDSSRLIAEAIAFLSKILDFEYKFYFKYKDELKNKQKVFIDLSIDSGFTMEYSTKRDLVESISYDKVFVIAKLSKNTIENIEYLLEKENNA